VEIHGIARYKGGSILPVNSPGCAAQTRIEESTMKKNPIPDSASVLHDAHKQRLEVFEKNLKEKKDELSLLIQEYPMTSVLVALGLGIVIGKIFSSKR